MFKKFGDSNDQPQAETMKKTVEEWSSEFVGKYIVNYPDDYKPAPPPVDAEEAKEEPPVEEQNKQTVAWESLPQPFRVIWPGSRVTRDLRPQRLNLVCNGQDKVTDVRFF